MKAVELAIAKENLNGEFNPSSCTITSGTTKCGDKTLNVTVDGELPQSGTITLTDGTIIRDESTSLKYSAGILTYDSNGKLTIESPKEELIAEGTIIPETTNGVAVNVDNQLIYYVPEGSAEATVFGYRENLNPYGIPLMGRMNYSTSSGEIQIASKVKINGIIYDVTSIGDTAFYNSVGLSSIEIPSSITSVGLDAFFGTAWFTTQQQLNNGLVIAGSILIDGSGATGEVVIPAGVKSIRTAAFSDNQNITSVTIPEGVTSIADSTFNACYNLSSVTIPSTVTNIVPGAFNWCTSLTIMNINKTEGSIE